MTNAQTVENAYKNGQKIFRHQSVAALLAEIEQLRAELAAAQERAGKLEADNQALACACTGAVKYFRANTLNFQYEKMNDHIREIEKVLDNPRRLMPAPIPAAYAEALAALADEMDGTK